MLAPAGTKNPPALSLVANCGCPRWGIPKLHLSGPGDREDQRRRGMGESVERAASSTRKPRGTERCACAHKGDQARRPRCPQCDFLFQVSSMSLGTQRKSAPSTSPRCPPSSRPHFAPRQRHFFVRDRQIVCVYCAPRPGRLMKWLHWVVYTNWTGHSAWAGFRKIIFGHYHPGIIVRSNKFIIKESRALVWIIVMIFIFELVNCVPFVYLAGKEMNVSTNNTFLWILLSMTSNR